MNPIHPHDRLKHRNQKDEENEKNGNHRNGICISRSGALRAERAAVQISARFCFACHDGGAALPRRGRRHRFPVSRALSEAGAGREADETGVSIRPRHDSFGYRGTDFPHDRVAEGFRGECIAARQFRNRRDYAHCARAVFGESLQKTLDRNCADHSVKRDPVTQTGTEHLVFRGFDVHSRRVCLLGT